MRYQEHCVAASRRVELFVREFQPDRGAEQTVVLLHGAGEHSGRHRHVAERLCRSGWRVLSPDLRGHGRSGGRSMHLTRFCDYVADVSKIYDHFELDARRTVQIGHSMGGLATARFAQTNPGRIAAVALACPLLGLAVQIPPRLLAAGKVLSVAFPWTRFRTVVNPTDVSRCERSIAERLADPLYRNSVTAGWFFAVRRAMEDAWRDALALTSPLLVVQSAEDRIVDRHASREWLLKVGSRDSRFFELPEQFHEWHREESWRSTTDLISRWLSCRIGSDASSSGSRLAA